MGFQKEKGQVIADFVSVLVASAEGQGNFQFVIAVVMDNGEAVVMTVGNQEELTDQFIGIFFCQTSFRKVLPVEMNQHGIRVPDRKL